MKAVIVLFLSITIVALVANATLGTAQSDQNSSSINKVHSVSAVSTTSNTVPSSVLSVPASNTTSDSVSHSATETAQATQPGAMHSRVAQKKEKHAIGKGAVTVSSDKSSSSHAPSSNEATSGNSSSADNIRSMTVSVGLIKPSSIKSNVNSGQQLKSEACNMNLPPSGSRFYHRFAIVEHNKASAHRLACAKCVQLSPSNAENGKSSGDGVTVIVWDTPAKVDSFDSSHGQADFLVTEEVFRELGGGGSNDHVEAQIKLIPCPTS